MSTESEASSWPEPLDPEEIEKVSGVLSRIALGRLADYGGSQAPIDTVRPSDRPSFADALRRPGLSVIAEVKRASPSQGVIAPLDPLRAAEAYAAGGAAAISVLTEPRHFSGSIEHLERVASEIDLPLLCKDFTVHPAQLPEAKRAGASAVLLIVALLGQRLGAYVDFASSLHLDALVEVHDERELSFAIEVGARIIGVNNRDLRTLEIDLKTAPRLIAEARGRGYDGVLVAESGYRASHELKELRGLADAVLVGTSLAGSEDLEASLRKLTTD
ncbi:MAG: indole-3-glycerol phosphate synthase TrpC [Trueperaceae bacterium]|nr:MAG: indole-3-glycerol phosphate synthase TrpC [Trueperaceae bacterium]